MKTRTDDVTKAIELIRAAQKDLRYFNDWPLDYIRHVLADAKGAAVIRPAKRDMDPDATSHAGEYDGFGVHWVPDWGWGVVCANDDTVVIGPFHTSQAAFGAAKDAIDSNIREGR